MTTKRSTAKGGGSFKLDVKPTGSPLMSKGFYAVEITGVESGLTAKTNKPKLTVTLDVKNEENEGCGVRVWIGDWNPHMYINLLGIAGLSVEEGIACVDDLVGVTGYAFLDRETNKTTNQPVTVVKNLITRKQMEDYGHPIPFEFDQSGDSEDVESIDEEMVDETA